MLLAGLVVLGNLAGAAFYIMTTVDRFAVPFIPAMVVASAWLLAGRRAPTQPTGHS